MAGANVFRPREGTVVEWNEMEGMWFVTRCEGG